MALALSAPAATYNNASLNGTYNFLTNLRTANATTNQTATVGVLTFNGAGKVTSGSYTQLSLQAFQSGTLSGSYAVKADGTGTLTIKFTSSTGSFTAKFAVVLGSNPSGEVVALQLLQTNDPNNEIVVGSASLLSTTAQTYSLASLNGVFVYQYKLFTADPAIPETDSVGLVSFNGNGSCQITSTMVSDGKTTTKPQSCTYTVGPNGIGSVSTGAVFALSGVSSGQANGLQFLLNPNPSEKGNYVIVGNAALQ
jgi:hypothetical protein